MATTSVQICAREESASDNCNLSLMGLMPWMVAIFVAGVTCSSGATGRSLMSPANGALITVSLIALWARLVCARLPERLARRPLFAGVAMICPLVSGAMSEVPKAMKPPVVGMESKTCRVIACVTETRAGLRSASPPSFCGVNWDSLDSLLLPHPCIRPHSSSRTITMSSLPDDVDFKSGRTAGLPQICLTPCWRYIGRSTAMNRRRIRRAP